MKKIIITLAMVLMVCYAFGQAIGSEPTVSNLSLTHADGWLTINYDLSFSTDPATPRTGEDNAENPEDFVNQDNYRNPVNCHVSVFLLDSNDKHFYPGFDYIEENGDIGTGVEPGAGKQIRWHIQEQVERTGFQGVSGENFRAKVIARRDDNYDPDTYDPDDPELSVPAGMIFVEGTGENGDPEAVEFNPGGHGYFAPAEDYHVSLSSFYISQFEVTQSEWTSVMGGIHDPRWDYGQGPNHPAYRISWFEAIEYCNRRSMMEGLTPCYSYSVGTGGDSTYYGTNPDNWPAGWNEDRGNHTNVSCNWEANGYRLPTEMEWEYAARGGVPAADDNTFSNTYAGTDDEADLGDYAWYSANTGGWPDGTTHPVGTKLPNELGLYDMSGNVWNWVWDIWHRAYPTGSYNDPTGPETGTSRVYRGGSWCSTAAICTVSYRNGFNASSRTNILGFRVSRVIP